MESRESQHHITAGSGGGSGKVVKVTFSQPSQAASTAASGGAASSSLNSAAVARTGVVEHPLTAAAAARSVAHSEGGGSSDRSSNNSAEADAGVICPPPKRQITDITKSLSQFLESHAQGAGSSGRSRSEGSRTVSLYLIPSSWWNRWLSYTEGKRDFPGPIENDTIAGQVQDTGGDDNDDDEALGPLFFPSGSSIEVAYASTQHRAPKEGCCAVPEVVWAAMKSWFGGGPKLRCLCSVSITSEGVKIQILRGMEQDVINVLVRQTVAMRIDEGGNVQDRVTLSSRSMDSVDSAGGGVLSKDSCFVCGGPSSNRCARCCKIYYCSRACQLAHWNYHKLWCNKDDARICGKKGIMGLFNTGNSCYLNSSLQCLTHCIPLTNHFLTDRFKEELNPGNIDGSGPKNPLVCSYGALCKEMWFGTNPYCNPKQLKDVLGSINRDYYGTQQQDAHDVLELILDRIHEDLNKVQKKPYVEQPEGDGTNDVSISADAWSKHRLRHDSIITDLFGGQYKSKVACCTAGCNRVSVTFDYFNTLQLAIPAPVNHVTVFYVPFIKGIGQVEDIVDSRRVVRCVLEDLPQGTAATVLQAKQMLIESLRAHNRIDHKVKPADLSWLICDSSTLEIDSLAEDAYDVNKIPANHRIFAYFAPPHKQHANAVLLQRKPAAASSSLFGLRGDGFELFGYPLFLSFDSSWSCSRVRYLIWQQMLRYLDPSVIKHINAVPEEVVKRNQIMCSLIRVYISNQKGAEITNQLGALTFARQLKKPVPTTSGGLPSHCPDWIASSPPLLAIWNAHREENLRLERIVTSKGDAATAPVELPIRSDVTIAEFFASVRVDGIPYMSVKWDRAWSTCYNQEANEIVALEESEGQDENSSKAHTVSLEKCFRLFTKQEVMSGENAWYCRNCKEHVSAQKEIQLWSLPRILVVGLKRFAFRGGAFRSKISDYVDFPIDGLNLREYCGAAAGEGGDDDNKYIYDLFAVCNHFGRMGFGHYTSNIREWSKRGELTNHWLSCDDENVAPCREEDVKTNAAYILFYIRRG